MAKLTIGQTAIKYKIGKTTLHNKMAGGKLGFELNEHNERVIDEAELERVFGHVLKKREEKEVESVMKNGSLNAERLVEFYEMKSKFEIAVAKQHMAEKRIYEVEAERDNWKKESESWKTIAERLSLPAPGTVPENKKEPIILSDKNSPTPSISTSELKNEQFTEPASKLNVNVPGEGMVVPKNPKLIEKILIKVGLKKPKK